MHFSFPRPNVSAMSLAALSLAIFTPTAVRAQNIPVQNSSFESPTVPANPGYTTNIITGWSGAGGVGVTTGDFGVVSLATDPLLFPGGIPDGAQYAYINSGIIYQDTAMALTAGDTYTLTAYIGKRTDQPSAVGSINLESFTGGSPTAVLATSGSVTSPHGTFTEFTTSFTASSAQAGQDLGIVFAGPTNFTGNNQINFDDVSLTRTAPAVPEASTIVSLGLLLALGLSGLIVAGKRRKA